MGSKGKAVVELFFDVISPWSYLAFETLSRYHRIGRPQRFEMDLRPVLLGGVFKLSGNSAPITVPSKGEHMWKDLAECGEFHGVPLRKPDGFPGNTLTMQRVLAAMRLEGVALEPVVRSAWGAYWSSNRDISQPEVIAEVLREAGHQEPSRWLEAAQEQRAKAALSASTSEAVASGAFGVPWMLVPPAGSQQQHAYFGSDRFHLLLPRLGIPWEGPHPK